jgi:predicted NAD/FAD-dependent oxidoreductase
MEPGSIAISLNNQLYLGDNPASCLSQMPSSCQLVALAHQTTMVTQSQISDLATHERDLFISLFSVMHPGNYQHYASASLSDAFHRFYPSHHVGGNYELIASLGKGLNVWTNTRVHDIVALDKGFQLRTTSPSSRRTILSLTAARVLVATDAASASALTAGIDGALSKQLSSITYGPFVVCAFATSISCRPSNVTYVITADLRTTSILFRSTSRPDLFHVIVHFSGEKARTVLNEDERDIVCLAQHAVNSISKLQPHDIVDTRVAKWPRAGTVISSQTFSAEHQLSHLACGRLAIAGDYTTKMAYGIGAAARSGVTAAGLLMSA